jgi:type VI protein secretion system component VasK
MTAPTPLLAEITPASWHDVLAFAAPVLMLAVLAWLVSRTDRIVHAVFPDLEWERSLGWLNIRAERRASRAMRWVSYGVIVLLVDALVIFYWCAKGLPDLSTWADPWVMGDLALRVPVMGLCLLIWVIYLGLGLLPRMRAEREAAAYKKFRAQMTAADEEKRALEAMGGATSRGPAELPKPRATTKPTTLTPRRHWRQHPPGG